MKLFGEKRIVELHCLVVVKVLELSWVDKLGHEISVVDVDTGKHFEVVDKKCELVCKNNIDKEVEQKHAML